MLDVDVDDTDDDNDVDADRSDDDDDGWIGYRLKIVLNSRFNAFYCSIYLYKCE